MDVIIEPQKGRPFAIEVGFFDTVLEIKEKIQKYHGIPILKQTLIFNTHLLQDERDVEFCGILHNSHIQLIVASETDQISSVVKNENPSTPSCNVGGGGSEREYEQQISENSDMEVSNLRPSTTAVSMASGNSPLVTTTTTTTMKKLKVMVKSKCGSQKISVEVNALDNVGELKKELNNLHQKLHFDLPPEGFFFIYDRDVMDEDRSFRWHGVNQGDTIEIFNGSITGGS